MRVLMAKFSGLPDNRGDPVSAQKVEPPPLHFTFCIFYKTRDREHKKEDLFPRKIFSPLTILCNMHFGKISQHDRVLKTQACGGGKGGGGVALDNKLQQN